MQKLLLLSALFGFLLTTTARAQNTPAPAGDGFKITGQIKGVKDTTCVLAHYFGSTQYIPKDTARIDGAGNLVFEGKKHLPEGLYLVVAPKTPYIQFLITDDQDFTFSTDTANVIKNMKVSGSNENELFYGYQQRLSSLYDEANALNLQKKMRSGSASDPMLDSKLAVIQKQAQDHRKQFVEANKGTFAVKLLEATAEPDVPTAPKLPNGRPDSVWVFNYFKAHFWDNFDFADERFVRTPFLQAKIERYINDLTVQVPDSLIKSADLMVGKAQAGKNKEVLTYTIYYITSPYERPKVIGTDGLFVHMFEKYYATGIMPITDSSTIRQIGERVKSLKLTLVGKPMTLPNISDTLRRPIALNNVKADYTVVYFYDPHCGHCRDSAPKLKKFVDTYKGKGAEVVAVAIEQSPEEWKKFIHEFKLQKAINGYDYNYRTNYRAQYDVATTPMIYVLDKDKKIIARQLPIDQMEDFMLFHKKQQAASSAAKKPAVAPKNAKASSK